MTQFIVYDFWQPRRFNAFARIDDSIGNLESFGNLYKSLSKYVHKPSLGKFPKVRRSVISGSECLAGRCISCYQLTKVSKFMERCPNLKFLHFSSNSPNHLNPLSNFTWPRREPLTNSFLDHFPVGHHHRQQFIQKHNGITTLSSKHINSLNSSCID